MKRSQEQELPKSGSFKGMIAGDARIVSGSDVFVRGMIAGDLIVEAVARARIKAMIGGRLIDQGADLEFDGMVGRA